MRNIIYYLLVAGSAVTLSCGNDDKDPTPACSNAWATELQVEVNAITAAANAYAMDPSAGNCNAYKKAYTDYINALKPYGSCNTLTGQNKIDFENTLKEAEENIGTLC